MKQFFREHHFSINIFVINLVSSVIISVIIACFVAIAYVLLDEEFSVTALMIGFAISGAVLSPFIYLYREYRDWLKAQPPRRPGELRVGDWIYLCDDDDFDDHTVGGRAKINWLGYSEAMKQQTFRLKGFPVQITYYAHKDFVANQAKWRQSYGSQRAKLIEGVNGGM